MWEDPTEAENSEASDSHGFPHLRSSPLRQVSVYPCHLEYPLQMGEGREDTCLKQTNKNKKSEEVTSEEETFNHHVENGLLFPDMPVIAHWAYEQEGHGGRGGRGSVWIPPHALTLTKADMATLDRFLHGKDDALSLLQ